MSFLDTNGLTYFYGKLKEKFIRSVTAEGDNGPIVLTPDSNGNVTVNRVAISNNLASPDAQSSFGTFIYRTSGGTASLTSGEAQIAYIDGNVKIDGRIPENFQFDVENNIVISSYNAEIWRSEIDTTGEYEFGYNKPRRSIATSNWSPEIGTWSYDEAQVNLSNYGLTVVNIIAPSLSITTNSSSISSVTIVPDTWMGQISESGDCTFVYSATALSWFLNSTPVTLGTYGIDTNNAIPADEDEIYVSYNAGTPNSTLTVNYTAPEQGTIVVATPTAFKATGFNQFNTGLLTNNNDTGIIPNAIISNTITNDSSSGHYVCYVHAVGGVERGYVAYSETGTIRGIGWCENLPQLGENVVTTGSSVTSTISSILFPNDGYVVVEVTSYNDLCIHPRWSTDDETYEEYVLPSVKQFPTEDIEGTELPIGEYGMPAVGAVADRLDFDTGTYIKRIERIAYSSQNLAEVQAMEVNYDYDSNYIYYVRPTPVTYQVDIEPTYTVNDFGTEEFVGTEVPLKVQLLYGQNLRDKLRTDVVTISAQELTTNQKTQVCMNIGAVNKAGDTMTGNLNVQNKNPYFHARNSDISSTSTVSSDQVVIGGHTSYYSDSKYAGYLVWRINENGSVEADLRARKYVNGSAKDNKIRLIVNEDGTNSVIVTDPVAWCAGLGAPNIGTFGTELVEQTNIDTDLIDGYTYHSPSKTRTSALAGTMPTTVGFKIMQICTYSSTKYKHQLALTSSNTTPLKIRVYGDSGWSSWSPIITDKYYTSTSKQAEILTSLGTNITLATATSITYNQWGRIGALVLGLKANNDIASNAIIATLVTEKCPRANLQTVDSSNGLIEMQANGNIRVKHAIASGSTIFIEAHYLLAAPT